MNEQLKEWIQNGITDEAVDWAKVFAKDLATKDEEYKAMTTAQLRKFFGELRRIDVDIDNKMVDLPMLKPMLAYAVGRDKKKKGKVMVNTTKIKKFADEINKGLQFIRNDQNQKSDFKNLLKILESIVAYHKFYTVE